MVNLAERVSTLAGAGLLVWGISMIYVPAAVILSGVLLLAAAFWRQR